MPNKPLAPLPIQMVRDSRDEWPDDVHKRPGTFDIEVREDGRGAHLFYVCPGNRSCGLRIQQGPPPGNQVWGWDGNMEAPTITPSINCHSCGWHGWIRNGVIS